MAMEMEVEVGSPNNVIPVDEMTDEDALLMAQIDEVETDPVDQGVPQEMLEFTANLVPFMDEGMLASLALTLWEAAERD